MTILYSVYCIRRDDGKRYIGKAKNIQPRMNSHKKTNRFKNHSFTYEILFQSEDHQSIEEAEKYYILWMDTYNNGLNKTKDGTGNHNSIKFTTFGKKFSEESKKKISENHWSKRGYKSWSLGKHHTEETKFKISQKKLGKISFKKYDENQVRAFLNLYKTRPIIKQANVVQANGRKLPYDRAFVKQYAMDYNIQPAAAYKILKRKTLVWKPLIEQILDSKF